jgi:hypothetical protein
MTEPPEVHAPDGSLMSDMAQKMAKDIDTAIARFIPLARTMGVKDLDIKDMVMSALSFNVARLEQTFKCIGEFDVFLGPSRKDIQRQLDEEQK